MLPLLLRRCCSCGCFVECGVVVVVDVGVAADDVDTDVVDAGAAVDSTDADVVAVVVVVVVDSAVSLLLVVRFVVCDCCFGVCGWCVLGGCGCC